jgi:hypothetical protein
MFDSAAFESVVSDLFAPASSALIRPGNGSHRVRRAPNRRRSRSERSGRDALRHAVCGLPNTSLAKPLCSSCHPFVKLRNRNLLYRNLWLAPREFQQSRTWFFIAPEAYPRVVYTRESLHAALCHPTPPGQECSKGKWPLTGAWRFSYGWYVHVLPQVCSSSVRRRRLGRRVVNHERRNRIRI